MMNPTILLCSVFISGTLASIQNYHSFEIEPLKTKPCRAPGLQCSNCTTVVACIEVDGDFKEEVIEKCEESCYRGDCVMDTPDPFCNGLADLDFKCMKVGTFPDPFYCDQFVFCVENSTGSLISYRNECDTGYMYNIATSDCDIPLSNGECKEDVYPVPLCEYPGQTGSFPEKRSMYYVCERYHLNSTILFPVLDECPGGQEYYNYQCYYATTTNYWTTTYPTTARTTDSTYPTPTTN